MSETVTDNELSSLEKIAILRGRLGRMRAKVVKARNLLLSHEHVAPPTKYERDALTLLSEALRES